MKRRCPKCGAEWEIKGPISFREECPECAAFMHTCLHCRHWHGPSRRCRIPTTEPVRDPAENNFCEDFEFGPGGAGAADEAPRGGTTSGPGKAPGAGAPGAGPGNKPVSGDEARRRFDDLFRDPKT